ncbi:MAG TPA: hypothetical protein VH044_13545 [Polyangiaceae bacterium]|jgi:hypothetical protein|nr:hypothetical protein [Polyangiaceae bacterium]
MAFAIASATTACSSSSSPTTCDASCKDGGGVRALRDAMKLVYNLTLQGGPTGAQDATTPCPLGGTAHVTGTASSVPDQGTTMVQLTYDFVACDYAETDSDPTHTFSLTLTGTITETGNIASEPSSTTSLTFASDAMTLGGTVFAPTVDYRVDACVIALSQDGDNVSGKVCGRSAGTSL